MTPCCPGYFADPFVTTDGDGTCYAYGTTPSTPGPCVFQVLTSRDLHAWRSHGAVLDKPAARLGDAFWTPEVVHAEILPIGRDERRSCIDRDTCSRATQVTTKCRPAEEGPACSSASRP